MDITFNDNALEALYLSGKTAAKKYARLPKDVVKRYANMNNSNTTTFVATHPGELMRDEMRERGLTQKQLAEMAGLSPTVVIEVVRAKRSVNEEIAVSLEKAMGIPVVLWMNLQSQYDNDTAAKNTQHEKIVVTIPVSNRNLLRDLSRKFGWACM